MDARHRRKFAILYFLYVNESYFMLCKAGRRRALLQRQRTTLFVADAACSVS